MIVVMIVPTGIGAEIGGHAGDANPAARLLGACCDTLILHPNVVNASDINEMPENSLYVEGSILDRFLRGELELEPRRHNRILVVANKPVGPETINAVGASRATAGVTAEVVALDTPLIMKATLLRDGQADGTVTGCEELVEQLRGHRFDALAIHTPIDVDKEVALHYLKNGGVNPWGRVEAIASKRIAALLNKPVAHAPVDQTDPNDANLYLMFEQEAVDARIAAEVISNCFLHCVLKGLNRAPIIGKGLSVKDVDVMVAPWGCLGPAHRACIKAGVPIIEVRENKTVLNRPPVDGGIVAENYWEAAGIIMTMRAGIAREAVRRPFAGTFMNGTEW